MSIHFVNAAVIYPDRVEQGFVTVEGHRIKAAGKGLPETGQGDQVYDLRGKYLSPGFVEIHSHGAGGCDFMDGTAEAVITAAKTHLQHGTTTLFPTTLAASREEILNSIDGLRLARRIMTDGPELPGLHMEGPYLNRKQKGAIDEQYIRDPQREEYEEFIFYGEGAISRWTLAPELPGAMEFARCLRDHGIVPSMGHTDAEYSQVLEAYHNGINHVTHLYSAMSGMVRKGGFRYPGLIESAFCIGDLTVEVIADGCHLPVEILEMVYRLKGAGEGGADLRLHALRRTECEGIRAGKFKERTAGDHRGRCGQDAGPHGICGQHRHGRPAGAGDVPPGQGAAVGLRAHDESDPGLDYGTGGPGGQHHAGKDGQSDQL